MKWKSSDPSSGEIRVVSRFLFLPTSINGEVRWFEWATIQQKYYSGYTGGDWENTRWLY